MSYVNKTHKINFALDDYDYEILVEISEKRNCSYAEVFRILLESSQVDLEIVLSNLTKEVSEIKNDLIKLVRS